VTGSAADPDAGGGLEIAGDALYAHSPSMREVLALMAEASTLLQRWVKARLSPFIFQWRVKDRFQAKRWIQLFDSVTASVGRTVRSASI
jgi:hypothetical protein